MTTPRVLPAAVLPAAVLPDAVLPDADRELELIGGTANRGKVFLVGGTVRRPLRPASAATHAVLQHLERIGFDGAPRFLGIDEHDREVLSYVEGDAATAPAAPWALSDEALVSVGRLLRRYHDAVKGFDPSGHTWTRQVPAMFRGPLVCHNDANLDNVVFRDGQAVALIDFDLAAPDSAVWDVALAARLWAPLREDQDISDVRKGRVLERFRTFVDAYGLTGADRSAVVDAVLHTHDWCYAVVRDGVAAGHAGFTDYWGAAAARAARSRGWYERCAGPLRDALA